MSQTDRLKRMKSGQTDIGKKTDNVTTRMGEMTLKEKMKLLKQKKESGDFVFFFPQRSFEKHCQLNGRPRTKKIWFLQLRGDAIWKLRFGGLRIEVWGARYTTILLKRNKV